MTMLSTAVWESKVANNHNADELPFEVANQNADDINSVTFEEIVAHFEFLSETKNCDVEFESRVAIIPSEACLMKNKYSHYIPVLRALGVDPSSISSTVIRSGNSHDFSAGHSFRFEWIQNDVRILEPASYNHTKEFLERLFPGQPVHVIANDPEDFIITMVYSLQQLSNLSTFVLRKAGFPVPRMSFLLRGRSDLVVLRKNETVMIPESVEFAVEIKPKYDLDDQHLFECAFREAVLLVIGLNAGNCQCSPAVVLTDLVEKHYVLYIERRRISPLKYSLEVESFTTLSHACQRASFLGLRIGVTGDFGSWFIAHRTHARDLDSSS